MTQPLGPLDPLTGGLFYLLSAFTLICLAVGVPILIVLAIRFLWYRHVYVGRSAELEKLVWQLHRIASALEAPQVKPDSAQTSPASAQEHPVHMSMFGR